MPITLIFLLSHLIPHNSEFFFLTALLTITHITYYKINNQEEMKKFFDLHKTQFFNINALKAFKFAAILVHHSHQSSSVSSQS